MNLYDILTVDEYSQQLFSESDRSDPESEVVNYCYACSFLFIFFNIAISYIFVAFFENEYYSIY